jgi:hypothetical protein
MLLAVDLHEYFIDEEGVAIASVLPLQSHGIFGAEFDTPQANRFAADDNSSFSQQIFDVSMTEVEPEIEPDSIADDIRRESMAFICIHRPILAVTAG